MTASRVETLLVDALEAGLRIDQLLQRRLASYSRAQIKILVREGTVSINGERASSGMRVAAGDRVEVRGATALAGQRGPQADPSLPLSVLYCDESLLCVDKPPGLPVHPLRPDQGGTLVNALLARFPEIAGFGYSALEPGLLHRLDNETSGVLVVARDAAAFLALRQQFTGRTVLKGYRALVEGDVRDDGVVDWPIAHEPSDRRRMRVLTPGDIDPRSTELARHARAARTRYRIEERLAQHTLLEVEIAVGMRHQIRAHLAALGTPIAGDRLYGARTVQPAPGFPARTFLHAARIQFVHPVRGGPLRIESPLPTDLTAWLAHLRGGPQPEATASSGLPGLRPGSVTGNFGPS